MKKFFIFLIILSNVLLFTSCDSSDDAKLSSENYITDFLVEGHTVEFNQQANKVIIRVAPNFYDTMFKYTIVGVAPKARTSISLKGNLNIFNNQSFFTVYAENGESRKIEIEIVKLDGIIDAIIINSQNIKVDHKLLIKDDSIDVLVDKDLIQSFFPLVSYNFTFNTTPGSYVEEIKDVIVGADTPFRITYVTQDGTKKEYTVAFKNYKASISYLVMPAITFKTNINHFPNIWALKVMSRSSTGLPDKYTAGLSPNDNILLTLETEREAYKNIAPLILRVNHQSSVSPAIDEARDFTKDVVYTVTSESGIPTEIKVRTFFEKFITNLPIQYIQVSQRGSINIRYYAISPIEKVKLINTRTSEVVATTITHHNAMNGTALYDIYLQVDTNLPKDIYDMELTLENNDVISKPIQQVISR